MIHMVDVSIQSCFSETNTFIFSDGGYPTGGFGSGYITTAIVPGAPIGAGISPYGAGSALGRGNYGLGGGLGLPPKIRVIFIPQGGAG
jgi:hypothetical protein